MKTQRVIIALATTVAVSVAGPPVTLAQEGGLTLTDPLDGTVIPGHYIVVFKESASRFAVQSTKVSVMSTYGADVYYDYSTALNGFAATLSDQAVAALEQDPNVAYLEPDRVISLNDKSLAPAHSTDATQTNAMWGLDRIDQRDLPLDTRYTYSQTASNVNVYVIDTGIRLSHSEFGGRAISGYTAINDGNGANDCNGHGTHVAGTIGGTTYGVAKAVKLYAVRVLSCNGSGSTSGVIAGVDWVAANRAQPAVANMSLGGSASPSLDTAVKNSINAGVVYAIAAGNDYGANACNYSPARVPEAITVGATERTDARASYSNTGTCLDIFAPGSGITSAWNSSDSALNTISGTSMASPHVAGAAAKVLQDNPSASPSAVRDALVNDATLNKITNPGTGSPNRLLYSASGAVSPPTDNDGGAINFGETRNGTINPAGDTDDFTFNGTAGQIVLVTQNKNNSNLDSFVELYKPDGSLLGSDDDSGGNYNSRLQAQLPVNGTYRIRARAYGSSTGAYTLQLSLVSAADTDDSRWIAFGQTLTGTISPSSDRDTYYVSVVSGRTLRLRMNKISTGLDSYLELYSPSGTRVAYNDDGGGNQNSLISYKATQNGTFRIVARSYNGASSGQYQLILEAVTGQNLALNQAAVASSTEAVGLEPWRATDADLGTRWSSSRVDNQWWYVDLGADRQFDQVMINWASSYAHSYGLYVWDGKAWSNVFWTNAGDGGLDTIGLPMQSSRYVMFYGGEHVTSSAGGFSFYSFGVFNTATATLGVEADSPNPESLDSAKSQDDEPPVSPPPPAEDGKDPQLVGEGEFAQENAPAADSAPSIAPGANITVELPVAIILQADSLSVDTQTSQTLRLVGEASANAVRGRSIAAYEWRSHRDGLLTTQISATLPITPLSAGPHLVTFRAKDDQGNWSLDSTVLWVKEPAQRVFVPIVRR